MNEKKKDIIALSCVLLVVAAMFSVITFGILPEILSEKSITDSNPIEVREEWEELFSHPNRLPTYMWILKVSEGRDRAENTISFNDFNRKFDNGELVRVVYVVEYSKVVLYGDEEISPSNIKLWKSVATPEQKFNSSVSFTEPTRSEDGIVYEELSKENFWMKMIFVIMEISLFVIIIHMLYSIKKVYDKDYEETDENNKETRS